MKKVLLLLFLFISFCSWAQSVKVSGAGSDEVNGIYCVEGTSNGANYYVKDNIYIYRNSSGSHWRIGLVVNSSLGNEIYYTTYDESSNNPSVPWGKTYYASSLGSNPTPTVESYNSGDFENYNFSTQQEINDFGVNYPCASRIGNLFIGVSNGISDIDDLSPLQNITQIAGNLSILNTSLTHVDGLSGLTSTGGYVYIRFNHSLLNLDGLSNLVAINGYIEVRQNDVIEDISGLQNIDPSTITNNYGIQIVNNPNLSVCNLGNFCAYLSDSEHPREISGNLNQCVNNEAVLNTCSNSCAVGDYTFNSQQEIDDFASNHFHCDNFIFDNLTIEGNDITNLQGLSKISQINGFLMIQNNPLLENVQELAQVESIGGNLIIKNNESINGLEGLNNLTDINGNLKISENNQLIDISALVNLNAESISGAEGLIIQNNPQLSVCNMPNFCTYLSNSENPRIIEGNAAECINEEALESVCLNCEVPFNLNADNISDTQADISWESSGNLSDIEWGTAGFTLGNGTRILEIEGNFYTINELSSNSDYEYYVRQNCGGLNQSEWAGPYGFSTFSPCPSALITQTQTTVDNYGVNYPHCRNLNTLFLYGSATNLDGLSNLTSIGSIQSVGSNLIQDFNGLNNVTAIESNLYIKNSSGLENLTGFESLAYVGGDIEIFTNPQLKTITAFSNLTETNGAVRIYNNDQLTDISGFENIQPETMTILTIQDNDILSACNLSNFCEYLSLPPASHPRYISGNAQNCTNDSEITAVCSPIIWTEDNEWSNDSGPTYINYTEINGTLSVGTDTPDFEAKTLTVNENASLTIQSGHSVSVKGHIDNLANAEDFIIEDGANLIQTSNLENSGEITVQRNSDPMIRLDYTLWSSPVTGQNLFNFSPETVNGVTNYIGSPGRIYVYEGENGYVNPNPFLENTEMNSGIGYLFRSPNNFDAALPSIYEGTFTGVPFNGNLSVATVANNYTSIGNPYPSNLDADLLLGANPGLNTLYFWVNTPLIDGEYSGSNYATYNLTGGVSNTGTTLGEGVPSGIISAGQGFIVSTSDDAVVFNNSMRTDDPADFFKTTDLERHRLWLNLSTDSGIDLNQILIGYMEGATIGIDAQIDGKLFGYEGSAIYSLIDDASTGSVTKFTIQGRSLPFEDSDVVPIGFRAENSGKFIIELADFDGFFAEGQKIYLKDKDLGFIQDLSVPYEFDSEAGTFDNRFEIVYKDDETMSVDDLTTNGILIYKNLDFIEIASKESPINSVEIFDLSGRKLFSESTINSSIFHIGSKQFGSQVLIVRVKTQNEVLTNKKMLNY